jgi:hypothetical protein
LSYRIGVKKPESLFKAYWCETYIYCLHQFKCMGLFELLNEPYQRQAVLAGAAATIGFGRGLLDIIKLPGQALGAAAGRTLEAPRDRLNLATVVMGTAVGVERAVMTSTPLAQSYIIETASDAASIATGYAAGKAAGYWLPVIAITALTRKTSS